jgi:hypothetical protein
VTVETNHQYCINADNTVLCCVKYSDPEVILQRNWSLNCSFYLARLQPTPLKPPLATTAVELCEGEITCIRTTASVRKRSTEKGVNYFDEKNERPTFSDNLSLVGVMLQIAPEVKPDDTDARLEEIRKYFSADDSMFLRAGKREARCAFSTEIYTRGCHWFPRLLA